MTSTLEQKNATDKAENTNPRPLLGEPRTKRRKPKMDALLADAVDFARSVLEKVAEGETIGEHHTVTADDDRVVTHRFVGTVRGYRGWDWYVTLARASRSKEITVCETGLLPGDDALLAPAWVPWDQRVNAEERDKMAAVAKGEKPEKSKKSDQSEK